MADITTTFRYDGDFGPLKAQIKALSRDISDINAQFKSFDTIATKAMYGAAKAFRGDVSHITGYKTSVVDLSHALDRFGTAITRQKLSLREYAKEAAGAFKSTSNARLLAEREVARMQSSLIQFGASTGKGMLVTPLANNMSDLATKTAIARKQFDIFNTLVQDGATKLINFGKNTQWSGRQLMVGLTLPITMLGQALTKTFTDAESELTRFAKVYGSDLVNQSYDATEKMKEQVKGLSKTIAAEFGTAVKETNALAADLAAAGYEGQKLLDMTYQTSRLAILGEVDRQEAMKATLSLQNAFNMSTQQLSDSINFLNSVENQTSTSLQDLITAIPKTGPIINSLGGDIKDLSVLLVAMKEGGVAAGEGANALKSGLASLINPTQKAIDLAKQYGVDLKGIVEGTKGQLMPTVIGFQDALKNLDDFARAKVIEQVFGKYQFARMSALFDNLNQQGSQTKKVLELTRLSTTDLAKQAYREMRILTESAPNRLKRATETLRAELIPLGAAVAETIIPIISKIGEVVQNVMNFMEKLPGPVKTFMKFGTVVVGLLGPIIMLVGLFANFGGNVVKLAMNIVNLGRAMMGIKTERFKMLSDDELAATMATQKLTTSFINQEASLNALNVSLTTYLAKLRQIQTAQPGMFVPGAPPRKRAEGGAVYGPGGPTGDKIPAMLSDGEYVIKASSVQKYGTSFMDKLNAGKFAMGGIVRKFQKGGRAGMERTHISAPMSGMTPAQAFKIAEKIPGIQTGVLYRLQQLMELSAKGFVVNVEFLNNLVVALSGTLNNALRIGAVSLETFAAEFSAGRDKWIPAVLQAGKNTAELANDESELSMAFDALEKHILQNLRKTGKSKIGDADIYAAQTAAQKQLTPAQRRTLAPIFGLEGQYHTMRASTPATREQLAAAGYTVGSRSKSVVMPTGSTLYLGSETKAMTKQSYSRAAKTEAILAAATQELAKERTATSAATKATKVKEKIATEATTTAAARRTASAPIIAPPPPPGTGGGGMMNLMGIASTVAFLPMSLQGFASATDKGTKAMHLFTTVLMAAMTLMQLKSFLPAGGLKTTTGGMLQVGGANVLTATRRDAAGRFIKGGGKQIPMATGIGGAFQRKGAQMAFKEVGGKAVAQTGAKAGIGRAMMAIGPGLANPYVLAGVAAIAIGTAAFMFFNNQHKKAMKAVKDESKAAFATASESAKMYGVTLNTVNKTIKNNASLISKTYSKTGKSKVADKDLIHVVEKDFKDLVSNVSKMTAEESQTQLKTSMMSLIAQGFKPEDAVEILTEVARQAKQSGIMSKEFTDALLNLQDVEKAGENAVAILKQKFEDAEVKFGGNSQKLGIAMAENIQGGLDLATQMMATSPEAGLNVMKFLYSNETAISKGAKELSKTIQTTLAAQGGKAGDLVFDLFGNPETIKSNLGQQMDMFIRFGGEYSKLTAILTKNGKERAEKMLEYDNAIMFSQIQAAKSLAAKAAEQAKILETQKANYVEAADAAVQRVEREIEAEDELTKKRKEAFENEKRILNRRKDIIDKNANDYVEALQRQQEAEDFYAEQRDTTLTGLKALAGGDVFGFAQARQQLQTQAESKGRQDTIAQIEQTKQAAIDAIEARIQAIEDAEAAEDGRHEKAIENLNAERDAIIANKNLVIGGYQNAIDKLKEMQSAGFDEQQALLLEFDKLINKEGGPVKNAQKGLEFFNGETREKVKSNIGELPGIFSSIPKAFSNGIKDGMNAAASSLGIDADILSQMIFSGLSKDYKPKLGGLKTGQTLVLPPASPASRQGMQRTAAYGNYRNRYATGGYISGPGGPRSDVIPAMLSNGEYVINAAAVQKYGVGAMNAINSGAMPMAMGGFAKARYGGGGMVSSMSAKRPVARYANGGLVSPSYNTPQLMGAPQMGGGNGSSESNITYNTITINANSADAAEVYNEFQRQMARYERGSKMGRSI